MFVVCNNRIVATVLLQWFRTSSKFSRKKSRNNGKPKWTTLKRVRIRPNYNVTVAFSW